MKTILSVVLVSFLFACGDASNAPCAATSTCPAPAPAGSSMCILPSIGGDGIPCDGNTSELASWTWLETSKTGEVAHRCNEVTCVSGAVCVVQSDVSGLDDGGELLMGTCR